jgi:hypothetical protein
VAENRSGRSIHRQQFQHFRVRCTEDQAYRQDRQNAFDAVAGKRDGACFFP